MDKINWKAIIPFRNRTVDRMLTIASMTFTAADTADAADPRCHRIRRQLGAVFRSVRYPV